MTREDQQSQPLQPGRPDTSTWTMFVGRHAVGDTLRATVTKTLPFGSLVESEGVLGLLTGPADVAVGHRVEATIANLDSDRRRFSMTR